jgi:ATP-dependent exoDNAse (exonuclease V) beta subunit
MPEIGEGRGGKGGRIARWELSAEPTIAMRLPSSWGDPEDVLTPEFRAMSENDKAEEVEELKRLFYVGCTRAKEMLLLSGVSPKKPQAITMLALLRGAFGIDEIVDRNIDLPGGEKFRVTVVTTKGAGEETEAQVTESDTVTAETASRAGADQRDFSCEAETGFALEPAAPTRLSYTAIAAFEQCAARFQVERVLGMRLPGGLGAPSKQLGLAVHRVLETYGESEPIDSDRMASIARYYRLDASLESRLGKAVEAYRSSSVAKRIRSCATVRREAPFAVRLESDAGGFVLGGNIDVYAVSEKSRALIVDYKTGDADVGDTELLERYELQAACYALAAFADGCDDVSVVFVRPEAPLVDGDIKHVNFSFNASQVEHFKRRIADAHAAMGRNEYPCREFRAEPSCQDCPVPRSSCSARPSQTAAD